MLNKVKSNDQFLKGSRTTETTCKNLGWLSAVTTNESPVKKAISYICLSAMLILQGCLAAAIPLALGTSALGAFHAYKTIQLTTGDGEVQIGFEKESYTNEEILELSKIRTLAIMPSSGEVSLEVAIAEELSSSGKLKVVTPSKVLTALSDITGKEYILLNNYTHTEKMELLTGLCKKLDADGLIYVFGEGHEINMNTWSFSRPDIVQKGRINIYSVTINNIILDDTIAIRTSAGDSNKSLDSEVNRIAGKTIAERILENYEAESGEYDDN